MDLRPHHLLCTQGYSGKGYNDSFVENMNQLIQKLRSSEPVTIHIICSTDDLCRSCPHMLGKDLCSTNDKVKRFDQKVMNYFHLEEKDYIYQELVKKIREEITPEMLADICDTCNWYSISACREKILGENRKTE